MICIRVPVELLSQIKSIDFDVCLDVPRRYIEVVDMLDCESGEYLGPASFTTGLTEL